MSSLDLAAADLEAAIACGDVPYEVSYTDPDDPTRQIWSVLDDASVSYQGGRTVLCLILVSADYGGTFMVDFTVASTPGTTLTLRNPVDLTTRHPLYTSVVHLSALQEALTADLTDQARRRRVAAALDALTAAHTAYPGHQSAASERLRKAATVAAAAAHHTSPTASRAVDEALRGGYAGSVLALTDAIVAATNP